MAYLISYRPKGGLACETKHFGPYETYGEAEDALATLPCAAECEHRYISELLCIDAEDMNATARAAEEKRAAAVVAAYGEGYEAGKRGKPIQACEYGNGTAHCRAWLNGWREARNVK